MFNYNYKEKHCSIGQKDQQWKGTNDNDREGCYLRNPFKKVNLHRDDMKGYTRDKGTCRNKENTKKWTNQDYHGKQPNIEACKKKCDERSDCHMFDYHYKEKHCSIGKMEQ